MGVESVVLGFTAVDSLHIEGVTEDEVDAFLAAEISEPVPAEDTLGGDDQFVAG